MRVIGVGFSMTHFHDVGDPHSLCGGISTGIHLLENTWAEDQIY